MQEVRSNSEIQSKTMGVLVLAHGMHTHEHGEHVSQAVPAWNASVLEAVKPLKESYPLEVARGMADPDTIKEAVRKLEEKDVSDVIVVPLFISSYSPVTFWVFRKNYRVPQMLNLCLAWKVR